MRFSTVAASLAVFGGAFGAVVYETEVQTITSCGPEVTNCPARTQTPVAATSSASVPVVSASSSAVVPVVSSSSEVAPVASTPVATTPVASTPVASVPVPMGTGVSSVPSVVVPSGPAVPVGTGVSAAPSVPAGTGAPLPSGATGTVVPGTPLNTSTPVAPSQPSGSTFEGAASIKSFSAVAAIAAAGAFFLA